MKELRKYSQFESVAEMDKSIENYLTEYALNERDRTVLWKVACYSVKFVGVSYLKVQTLADLTGYAKRTIQRSLKSLTQLGILTRIDQFKPVKGGYSASITVINPFKSHHVETPCEEATEPTKEWAEEDLTHRETITFKAKTSIKKDYVEDMAHELDQLEAIGVPTQFSTVALPYFDAPKVYKLWSRVQLAARKYAPDLVELTEIAVSSVRASVFASKVKRVRDFTGYFYGVISQKLTQSQRSLKCRLFNFLQ